jgi:hypothetical protein
VQQVAGRPDGRYGDRPGRPRPAVVAAVVVLATAFVSWVVWVALDAADPPPGADVTAFRVVSDTRIEVRVQASPGADIGADSELGCSVQALDRTREVVGVAGVSLRPGEADGGGTWVTVRTRDRAVTATVGRCVEA